MEFYVKNPVIVQNLFPARNEKKSSSELLDHIWSRQKLHVLWLLKALWMFPSDMQLDLFFNFEDISRRIHAISSVLMSGSYPNIYVHRDSTDNLI